MLRSCAAPVAAKAPEPSPAPEPETGLSLLTAGPACLCIKKPILSSIGTTATATAKATKISHLGRIKRGASLTRSPNRRLGAGQIGWRHGQRLLVVELQYVFAGWKPNMGPMLSTLRHIILFQLLSQGVSRHAHDGVR